MVGLKAAQALAFVLRRPFVGIHHHEAHLYSPWIKGSPPVAGFSAFQPNVSLIVSGGHTLLVHVEAELKYQVLGSTLDDAAGECFDKVGKLLGLGYPGGPIIDRLSEKGDADAIDVPLPMPRRDSPEFSFSGIKTSVARWVAEHGVPEDHAVIANLCAAFHPAGSLARLANRFEEVAFVPEGAQGNPHQDVSVFRRM